MIKYILIKQYYLLIRAEEESILRSGNGNQVEGLIPFLNIPSITGRRIIQDSEMRTPKNARERYSFIIGFDTQLPNLLMHDKSSDL